MNSRERVLCSLNHVKPDRAPTDLEATKEIWDKLLKHFKTTDYDLVKNALKIDCRWLGPEYKGPEGKAFSDGSYEGWGGSILRNVSNEFGSYEEVVKYALDEAETPDDIDRLLRAPDPDDYDFSCIPGMCKEYNEYFLLAGTASMFYYPTMVRSMEKIMIDMAINPEMAHYLFNKSVEWHLAYHERLFEAGKGRIDALQIADDFSSQRGPLMSREMFVDFFREPFKKFVDLGKSYGAKIYLHCCGSAYKLIPDLIDWGVEILDPIQTTASDMDPLNLKTQFGHKLSFHGAVNTQSILPNGTCDDVRNNVRELVETLGKGGGYIMSACHFIQADVPIENVLAMYELENRN
jgi:uroporphyrinogen decarboxylase